MVYNPCKSTNSIMSSYDLKEEIIDLFHTYGILILVQSFRMELLNTDHCVS